MDDNELDRLFGEVSESVSKPEKEPSKDKEKEPSDKWVGRRSLLNPEGASQGQRVCPLYCQAKKEDILGRKRRKKEGRKERKRHGGREERREGGKAVGRRRKEGKKERKTC